MIWTENYCVRLLIDFVPLTLGVNRREKATFAITRRDDQTEDRAVKHANFCMTAAYQMQIIFYAIPGTHAGMVGMDILEINYHLEFTQLLKIELARSREFYVSIIAFFRLTKFAFDKSQGFYSPCLFDEDDTPLCFQICLFI